MFDIYEFFNSGDVAKYLKDIEYKFTPLERAWIVWQSDEKHYTEKKQAWLEIIQTSDDFLVKKRNCLLEKDIMFHTALKEYMDYIEYFLKLLKAKEEGWVYNCSFRLKKEYEYYSPDREWEGEKYFSNFEECLKYCKKELEENSEYYNLYRITKIELDSENKTSIVAEFDKDGFRSLFENSFDYEKVEITHFFESLWFAFPIPFKKGDIVCTNNSNSIWIFNDCSNSKDDKNYQYHLEHADFSDMWYGGYTVTDDARLYWDNCFCYTDLKYYKGDFEGVKNLARIFSKYIKDDIPADLFINDYTETFLNKIIKDLKEEYSLFLPSSLEEIGLKKD